MSECAVVFWWERELGGWLSCSVSECAVVFWWERELGGWVSCSVCRELSGVFCDIFSFPQKL